MHEAWCWRLLCATGISAGHCSAAQREGSKGQQSHGRAVIGGTQHAEAGWEVGQARGVAIRRERSLVARPCASAVTASRPSIWRDQGSPSRPRSCTVLLCPRQAHHRGFLLPVLQPSFTVFNVQEPDPARLHSTAELSQYESLYGQPSTCRLMGGDVIAPAMQWRESCHQVAR
jgi:hypothetical protein